MRTGKARALCVLEDFKIYLVLCLQGFAAFWLFFEPGLCARGWSAAGWV